MSLQGLYEQLRREADRREALDEDPAVNAIGLTLPLALESLENTSPAGLELLALAAMGLPDRIPLEVFRAPAPGAPPHLAVAAGTPVTFNEAVTAVLSHGLARRDGDFLFIHRLVLAGVRSWLSSRNAEALREYTDMSLELYSTALPLPNRFSHFDAAQTRGFSTAAPHVMRLLDGSDTETAAELLQKLAWFARAQSHFTESAQLFARSKTILSRLIDERGRDPRLIKSLAWALHGEGATTSDATIGRALHSQEVALRRELLRADPSDADLRRDLSWGLNCLGDHEPEEMKGQHYLEALELKRSVLAERPDDPGRRHDLLWSLYRMSAYCRRRGDLTKAEKFAHEGLTLATALVDADPDNDVLLSTLAEALDSFAEFCIVVGRHDDATLRSSQALTLRTQLRDRNRDLGGLSLGLLYAAGSNARALLAAGRTEEARKVLDEAELAGAATQESEPAHEELAIARALLLMIRGEIEFEEMRPAEAEHALRDALSLLASFVAHTPSRSAAEIASLLHFQRGKALDLLGDRIQAVSEFETSLRLHEAMGRSATDALSEATVVRLAIVQSHLAAGDASAAAAMAQDAVASSRSAIENGEGAGAIVLHISALRLLGLAKREEGHAEEAVSAWTTALREGHALSEADAQRVNLNCLLGNAYLIWGDASTAIPHLEAALAITDADLAKDPGNRFLLQDVRHILGELVVAFIAAKRPLDASVASSRIALLE